MSRYTIEYSRERGPQGASGSTDASAITSGTLNAARLPATVVQTTGTYANPAWITELASTKITGTLTKLQQHAQTAYYDAAGTWAQAQVFQGATFNGNVSCPQATDGERFGSGGSVANYSTSVGKNATCTTNGVAVGAASSAAHTGVAVGWSSIAGSGATALGTQATAIGTTIAIGYQATTANLYAVALGNAAEAAFYSTALGYATKAPYNYSIALGAHAENTGNNQLTIGSPTAPISQITFPGSNNVTIVNPATFNGAVVFNNATRFKTATWHTSTESTPKQRFYFDADGTTYLQGHGSTPIVLRNGDGTDLVSIASSGAATFNGVVTVNGLTLPGQNAYAMRLTCTGDRAFKWEGEASGADYTTTFSNAGAGKHNITVSGAATFNGNVGIGTSPSNSVLDVKGDPSSVPHLYVHSTTTGRWAEVQIDNGNNQLQIGVESSTPNTRMTGTLANAAYIGAYGNYGLTFHTNNQNRLTITADGAATFNGTVSALSLNADVGSDKPLRSYRGATYSGWINGSAIYDQESWYMGGGSHYFAVGATNRLEVNATGINVTGNVTIPSNGVFRNDSGAKLVTGSNGSNPWTFFTVANSALGIKVGSLVVSSAYYNQAPTNGLFVEGSLLAGSGSFAVTDDYHIATYSSAKIGWTDTGGVTTASTVNMHFARKDASTIEVRKANGSAGDFSANAATFSSSVGVGGKIQISNSGQSFGSTLTNGNSQLYSSAILGLVVAGSGSSSDFLLTNKSGSNVLSVPTGTINVNVVGSVTSASTGKLGDFTAATLPSAASNAGHECNVTDSSVTTFGSTVAGGGSSRVKLYSNGTNWTVQAV